MKTIMSREGIYYSFLLGVVFLGAILREVNLMLLFASFLFAPVVIAWRLGRKTLRGLTVERKLPRSVYAGEPFIVRIAVTNPRPKRWFSPASWGVIVVDRICPVRAEESESEKPYEPAVYFEYIPNGQTQRQSYAGRLPHRGLYRLEPMLVSTRFPFGFFRNWFEQSIAEGETTEFCVYPKIGKLSERWKARHHETVENPQRHRYRPTRQTGEFLGVRPWQSGDAKKWIHWRAWAKHREPVVRQFEQHQNRDCAVILDLFHEGEWNETKRENFELAVSFTATLITELTRRGAGNIFFATSAEPKESLYGSICLPLLDTILHRLTLTEPDRNDELPTTLFRSLSQVDRHAELILVTTNPLELQDSPRFQSDRSDPRYRTLLQRLHVVDTSNEELADIFSIVE